MILKSLIFICSWDYNSDFTSLKNPFTKPNALFPKFCFQKL